ncbi:MAG: T3SS effector HopA1 family protein, partial [Bdellovibrio bacteriovorus]
GGYQTESFGKVRADAIAAALTRIARMPAEERSFEHLLRLVEEELVKRAIDPLRPHRNLEPDDPRRRAQCRLPVAGESDQDDESVMRRC